MHSTTPQNTESRLPFDHVSGEHACVLIATDFSDTSKPAALHGFRTATLWGALPHVLHVCKRSADGLLVDYLGERLLLAPEKARALLAEYVEQLLVQYRSLYGKPGFGVAVSHLLVGDPAECIVGLARELKVGLTVVGASQKDGVERLFLGSTAEKVVRNAEGPVLVSRPRLPTSEELIEPACPACRAVRTESRGERIWCEQHRTNHERRHTYHYRDKNVRVRENMPLLFPMNA